MARPTPDDFKALISDPSAKLCGNFINTLLKLPLLLYQWMASVATTDGTVGGSIPLGGYLFSAAPAAETDTFKLANGQELSRTDYADLYAIIGDVYGTPVVPTNFKVPDMRGKFPLAAGVLPSSTAVLVGATGGEENHVLVAGEDVPHQHYVANQDKQTQGVATTVLSDQNTVVTDYNAGNDTEAYKLHGDSAGSPGQTAPTPASVGVTSVSGGKVSAATAEGVVQPKNDPNVYAADPHNNMPPYMGATVYIRVK